MMSIGNAVSDSFAQLLLAFKSGTDLSGLEQLDAGMSELNTIFSDPEPYESTVHVGFFNFDINLKTTTNPTVQRTPSPPHHQTPKLSTPILTTCQKHDTIQPSLYHFHITQPPTALNISQTHRTLTPAPRTELLRRRTLRIK